MANPPDVSTGENRHLLWWLLGLLGCALAVLGAGILVVGRYVDKNFRAEQAAETAAAQGAPLQANLDQATTGLPVYPGAAVSEAAGSVELAPPDADPFVVTRARYQSLENPVTVEEWYQEKLGAEFQREGPGATEKKERVIGVEVRSDDTVFISEKDDLLRVVIIRKRELRTEITLARIGRPQAQ